MSKFSVDICRGLETAKATSQLACTPIEKEAHARWEEFR